MQMDRLKRAVRVMVLLCLGVGAVPAGLVTESHASSDYRSSFYYQAYDQGFRAGRADFQAGRPFSYHAALVLSGGVAGLSQDYRNGFKLGYQDGYASGRRASDWYYRHHRHDADCDEDADGGRDHWRCRGWHDNGKHKGWYKHHHKGHDGDDEDDDD